MCTLRLSRLLTCSLLVAILATPSAATVFYARDEALKLAFPDAERTEARDFFLTPQQRSEIERQARAPVDSDLLTVYTGYHNGTLLGYAILDTHLVRTLPETFLVVVTPAGVVDATHVLAFYEPLEYLPGERWLGQFASKGCGDQLRVGRDIVGITGSTLTAQAVSGGIRRALAIYDVLLEGR